LACVEECLLARGAEDAGDEAPTATTDCEAECAGLPAEPGRWCSAFGDRITEWRAGRRDDEGRARYSTTGRHESRAALDAECLLGETRPDEDPPVPEAGELLVQRLEGCRGADAPLEPTPEPPPPISIGSSAPPTVEPTTNP
jgi:hypothetical protein